MHTLQVEDEFLRPHPGKVELLWVKGLVGALDVLWFPPLFGSQQVQLSHKKHMPKVNAWRETALKGTPTPKMQVFPTEAL